MRPRSRLGGRSFPVLAVQFRCQHSIEWRQALERKATRHDNRKSREKRNPQTWISKNTCETLTMSRSRGRPESSTRMRREDCAALPVRILPNLPALPRLNPEAVMSFGGDISGLPFSITLHLIRTSRAWLCFCPVCGRRTATVYFPPGSAEPGCRACLGLVYGSQYDYTPEWAVYLSAVARWYGPGGALL